MGTQIAYSLMQVTKTTVLCALLVAYVASLPADVVPELDLISTSEDPATDAANNSEDIHAHMDGAEHERKMDDRQAMMPEEDGPEGFLGPEAKGHLAALKKEHDETTVKDKETALSMIKKFEAAKGRVEQRWKAYDERYRENLKTASEQLETLRQQR